MIAAGLTADPLPTPQRKPLSGHDGEAMFEVFAIDPSGDDVGEIEGDGGSREVFVLCDRESLWGISMTPEKARDIADWLRSAADPADASAEHTITPGGIS